MSIIEVGCMQGGYDSFDMFKIFVAQKQIDMNV